VKTDRKNLKIEKASREIYIKDIVKVND
jgi:hypothetical protein